MVNSYVKNMAEKKILYVITALPVGGAERFLLTLSKELIPCTGQQIIVNLGKEEALANEISGMIAYRPMARQSKVDPGPIKRLRKLVKRERPDIIFCINFFAYLIVRCALSGMWSRPDIVISYHSTGHLTRRKHWLHHLVVLEK